PARISRNFWSFRGDPGGTERIHPPFVELPFDLPIPKKSESQDTLVSRSLVVEGDHSLQEMQKLEFMARFGRPL
ncbi:hypothetical protein H0H87_011173, partial [Tephrocybe sp. NHM501043]